MLQTCSTLFFFGGAELCANVLFFLCSPLFMEMIQFDSYFANWVGSTTNQLENLGKIRLEDSGIDAGVG